MNKHKHVVYRDIEALLEIYSNASSLLNDIVRRVQSFSKVDEKSTFLKIEMLSTCSTVNIQAVNESIMSSRKNFPYRFINGGVLYVPSEDTDFSTYITSNKVYPISSEGGYDRIDFYNYLKNLMEYTITQGLMAREGMEDKKYMQDIGKAVQSKVPLAFISYQDIELLSLERKTPKMTNKSDLNEMITSFTDAVSAESVKKTKGAEYARKARGKKKGTTDTSNFADFKSTGQIPYVDGKPVENVSEYLDNVKKEVRQTEEKRHRGRPRKNKEGTATASKSEVATSKKPLRAVGQTSVGADNTSKKVNQKVDKEPTPVPKKESSSISKNNSGTIEKKPVANAPKSNTVSEVSIEAVTQEVGVKNSGRKARKDWYDSRKEDSSKGTESESNHKSSLVSALQASNQEVVRADSLQTKDGVSDIFKVAPQSEKSVEVHPKPVKEESKGTLPPAPTVRIVKKEVTWSRLESVEHELIRPNIPFKGNFNAQRGKLKGTPCLASLDDLDEAELIRCYPQLENQIKYAFYSMKVVDKQSLPEDSPELVYVGKDDLRFTREERFLVSLANSPLYEKLYKGLQLSCRVFETPTGVVYEKYNQFIAFCNPKNSMISKYPAFDRVAEDHELFRLKTARWRNELNADEYFKLNTLKAKVFNCYNRAHQFIERQGFFLESICCPIYTDLPMYMFVDEEKASRLYKERGYFWSPYYLDLLNIPPEKRGSYPIEVIENFNELCSRGK